jgi:hypothetical protein
MFLFCSHSDIQELTLILLLLLLQRLSDTEQPWFVTQDYGVDMYNRIGKEALMKFEGIDSGIGWFTMTGKVKSILGDIVRKPRSGWSREHVSKAIDGLTACLVNLICNDEWSNDARGKILFANPDCRKETVTILRKMDSCAFSVISAANELSDTAQEEAPTQEADTIGIDRQLAQLKRLMTKYEDGYSGFSEDGYDYRGVPYRGYMAFSKALPLID